MTDDSYLRLTEKQAFLKFVKNLHKLSLKPGLQTGSPFYLAKDFKLTI